MRPCAHLRLGIEFDWLGVDRYGHVAVFSTAGYGQVPVKVNQHSDRTTTNARPPPAARSAGSSAGSKPRASKSPSAAPSPDPRKTTQQARVTSPDPYRAAQT